MVQILIGKENRIFDEDRNGSQDEGGKEIDVNVVSCAVELPVLGRVKYNVKLFNTLSQTS